MAHYKINTSSFREFCDTLRAGDTVSISGTIYTARDAAHKRIVDSINNHQALPFDLDGVVIYYAGPTPAKPGQVIGSCGPTTSSRMDEFSPDLIRRGVVCMIGKGMRNDIVHESMMKHGCVYLAAIGGAGAIIAQSVKAVKIIAYDDLGCESIKELTVQDFPAVVAMDTNGGNIYKECMKKYRVN